MLYTEDTEDIPEEKVDFSISETFFSLTRCFNAAKYTLKPLVNRENDRFENLILVLESTKPLILHR